MNPTARTVFVASWLHDGLDAFANGDAIRGQSIDPTIAIAATDGLAGAPTPIRARPSHAAATLDA